ncbi:MAG: ribosome maturation factor RimM [Rhizobiaceae bacterium]|nr:ribosome maturation factor RimM [Rhizobiaceae bacterium]
MSRPKNPVQMAVIGAPHGIRGELRVKTYTGDPLALGDYGPLFAEDGRQFDITDIRPAKNVVVVRFRQVGDRNAAEALNGTALFVDRAQLPDDLEEDEFYHADLIGLAVRDDANALIGRITAFHDFGGGDIMEIERSEGGTVLIPFTRDAVPEIDLNGGAVTVDPAAAGLLDSEDEDDIPGDAPDYDPRRRPRGPKDAGGNR